jgi:hypothetical protein
MSIESGAQLFASNDKKKWQAALAAYPAVIEAQEVNGLPELDRWYREDLPRLVASRQPPTIDMEELSQVVRWKMRRGEWRARNLALVRGNSPEAVISCSRTAFDPETPSRRALAAFCELNGVGPATASAVLASVRPSEFAFLDDLVGRTIPSAGEPAFTVAYFVKFTNALVQKASELGSPWTAQSVSLALWSAVGGKIILEK